MNDNGYDAFYCRIHEYVTAELEGMATRQQRRDMVDLLRSNRAARQIYVSYLQEQVSLRWCYANQPTDLLDQMELESFPSQDRPVQRTRFGQQISVRSAAVVALTLLTTLFTAWWIAAERVGRDDARSAGQFSGAVGDEAVTPQRALGDAPAGIAVATITRVIDATWARETLAPTELSRLRTGQALMLETGQVELVFDTGVEVILEGRTHFEIRTPASAYSRLGSISARVGNEARGFTIETPTARVIDLGTEFGVSISEAGETEVAVFYGIVDLATDSRANSLSRIYSKRLNQGEALRVGKNGEISRVFAVASDRFPSAAANRLRHTDRLPLISDVRDNIRDPESRKFYKIVRSGLHEDAPAFVDRVHQWNGVDSRGIPAQFLGAEYVMPFNDDKHFTTHLEVTLFIARPAALFVFLSDTVDVPDWLEANFVDTGEDIGLDEGPSRWHPADTGRRTLSVGAGRSIDTVFSIWKRDVPSPAQVVMGGVARPTRKKGYNMYGIVAVPLEDALSENRLLSTDPALASERGD